MEDAPAKKAAKAESGSDSSDSEEESSDEESDAEMNGDAEKKAAPATNGDAEAAPSKKRKRDEVEEVAAPLNSSVYVNGFSYDSTEEAIREFFSACGEISTIRLPLWEDSGRLKGFGYIDFAAAEGATAAIAMNGQELDGRWLKIEPSNKGPTNKKPRTFELSERPDGCREVFVGNLSWNATDDEVWKCFEDCGAIARVRIKTDYDTGRSKGFGWVEFESEDAVDKAIKKAGFEIAGRPIRVDYGGKKQTSGGGRGRGRGRGGGRGGRGGYGGRGGGGGYGGGGYGGGRPSYGGGRGGGRGRGRGGGRGRGRGAPRKTGIKASSGTKITF